MATEPTKVGIKIVREMNLKIITLEENTSNVIKIVTYKLTDANGNQTILTADSEGNVELENLVRGVQYTLQQTSVDSNYEINTEIITLQNPPIKLI